CAGSTSSPAPSAPGRCSRTANPPWRSSRPGAARPGASRSPPSATACTEHAVVPRPQEIPMSSLSRRAFTAALAGTGAAVALPVAAQAAPSKGHADRIEEILAGMSVEQKIGQLFVAVGYGSRADQAHASNTSTTGVDTIAEIVRTHHVGGLIYFVWGENLQSIEQVATLSNDAQDAALESGGIPLIISADEERGV